MTSFTFHHYPILTPEQQSPMNALISRAMENFGKGTKLAYLPKQLEADIFAKKIGPLATLATTPMFLNNPQFQKSLGDLISKNLGYGAEGGGKEGAGGLPTYAEQAGLNATKASQLAHELSKAGKGNVGISGLGGLITNYGGNLGKKALDFFTGGAVNPDLSNKNNQFETQLNLLKNKAIQTQVLTPEQANETFKRLPNETPDDTMNRIYSTNPQLFQQQNNNPNPVNPETPPLSIDEKIARDEQERAQYGEENNSNITPKGASVLMETPDGKQWFVPADKVKKAREMGAKEVK